MPDTQTEVYAAHPVHGWVEVATFGIYSPTALSEYGVGVPVMNLGLGVERLAMIATGSNDVREMCHPQFFPKRYSDLEIAQAVSLESEPVSVTGKRMVLAIMRGAIDNATATGPCSYPVWEGDLSGESVSVFVEEPEEGAKLLGPACQNEIFVKDGINSGGSRTLKNLPKYEKAGPQPEYRTCMRWRHRLRQRLNWQRNL